MDRRFGLSLWSLAPVALLSFGCDSKPPQEGVQSSKTIRVVVVAEARDDPTWEIWSAEARRLEKQERFVKVELLAPPTQSPREQQSLLRSLGRQPLDAVCIAPTDAAAVCAAIDELTTTGVRVVTVGRDVPGSSRAAYCGPSETELGRAAARACVSVLEGQAAKTVMLLHAGMDDPIYGPRYRGFDQEFRQFRDLNLLREINCDRNRADALNLVREESRKYARAGCWAFLEDWPLRTAAAGERVVPDGCRAVLCSGSPRYLADLRNQRITALATYNYAIAARQALTIAVSLIRDHTSVSVQHHVTDVEVITLEDLADFERRMQGE